jgi:SOS response regulatory protein OraA/RecX
MLARRALTRAEIETRLAARTTEPVRAAAMARLEELRVLDDEGLAERLARDALERRSLGRYRIRAELLRRGIAEEITERVIAEEVPTAVERGAAEAVLGRFRAARGSRIESRKAEAAAFRHLISRGFPADLVRDLLRF